MKPVHTAVFWDALWHGEVLPMDKVSAVARRFPGLTFAYRGGGRYRTWRQRKGERHYQWERA